MNGHPSTSVNVHIKHQKGEKYLSNLKLAWPFVPDGRSAVSVKQKNLQEMAVLLVGQLFVDKQGQRRRFRLATQAQW